jgi:hypothetical protein
MEIKAEIPEMIDFMLDIQTRHGTQMAEAVQDLMSDELTLILTRQIVPEWVIPRAEAFARQLFDDNREQFEELIEMARPVEGGSVH